MKIRKYVAILLAFIFFANLIPAGVGRGVYAADENIKALKFSYTVHACLEITTKFFVGYRVGDIISGTVDYRPKEEMPNAVVRVTDEFIEKDTKRPLGEDETLKDNVAYIYRVSVRSFSEDDSKVHLPLGGYGNKINTKGLELDKELHEANQIDGEHEDIQVFEMEFHALNIDVKPSADLGEYILDLSSVEKVYSDNDADQLRRSIGMAREYGCISLVDADDDYQYYDLNEDGIADIAIHEYLYEDYRVKKLDSCSVKDSKISISLTGEGKKRLNTYGLTYFGTVTFVLSDAKPKTDEKKDNSSSIGGSSAAKTGETATKKNEYKNEWVNGQWYDANGGTSYTAKGQWKNDESGWWFEDESGWYSKNQWLRIDGKWYFFTESGYMDYSEYRDGCWLNADGSWDENYSNGTWHQDSNGWWFEDAGWYPQNQYLWIDGVNYWFDADGYCK